MGKTYTIFFWGGNRDDYNILIGKLSKEVTWEIYVYYDLLNSAFSSSGYRRLWLVNYESDGRYCGLI
jgi:hypothetical protein